MKKTLILLIAALGAVALTFCNRTESFDPLGEYRSLYDYFKENGLTNQQFTIDPTTNSLVITENGVQMNFPANLFLDENGNPVSGEVVLDLVEAFSAGDIIQSGMPTTSFGQLLESGGEFEISATVNGEPVTVSPDGSIVMTVPVENTSATNAEDMILYIQGLDENGNFTWIPAGELEVVDGSFVATLPPGFTGAVNIDVPVETPAESLITVAFNPSFPITYIRSGSDAIGRTSANVQAFLAFKEINSVRYMDYNEEEDLFYADSIPTNQPFDAVMIYSGQKDSLYLGWEEILDMEAILADTFDIDTFTVDMELMEVTEEELQVFLDTL